MLDHAEILEWTADVEAGVGGRKIRRALLVMPHLGILDAGRGEAGRGLRDWADRWGMEIEWLGAEGGWCGADYEGVLLRVGEEPAWMSGGGGGAGAGVGRSGGVDSVRTRRVRLESVIADQLAKVRRKAEVGGRGRPPRFPWAELVELSQIETGRTGSREAGDP